MTGERHVHAWRMLSHLDGCHYWTSAYACVCGATRVARGERDFADYGAIWALPEECERCRELLDGAEPLYSDEVEVPR